MSKPLDKFSRLVTGRPYITILVLVAITVVLAAGADRRGDLAEPEEFLPAGSAVATAMEEIDELFGDSGNVNVVTLVFRGEALTPGGLAQMDALLGDIAASEGVGELLATVDPIVAPTSLVGLALGTDGFASVTQADIDSVRGVPQIAEGLAAMTGNDTDGTPVAVARVRLSGTDDESVAEAERRINELAAASGGPLRASSVSEATIQDEYEEATRTGTLRLLGVALLLIAALLLLFLRTLSDLLLSLLGLGFTLVWVTGAEGWLGPNGLGWTGNPSGLTSLVSIIVISLTVDYAIQTVSHYREQRSTGASVVEAVRTGTRNVAVPLTLAAVTTIVSFLAGLFSPIPAIGDFGIVAGLGVGMSLIVMLTLVPAGRTIIDRRRESRGTLPEPRQVSGALPGIERAAQSLGRSVARRPAPYILAVAGLTVWLGFAATGLKTEFTVRDVLPRGGSVLADLDTLEAAIGGPTEVASVLVKAEATETRTLLNLNDLTTAFEDERRRPPGAAGPIETSYESLVADWTTDSGEPGDNYDPRLAALFREASAGVRLDPVLMQRFIDELEARDPSTAHVLVNDPTGIDTMLLQFPTYTHDPVASRSIQGDIEALWQGDDGTVTVTSGAIIGVTAEDRLEDGQTEAISVTIAVSLGILVLFFWLTLRQPVLGVVAVAPIVLVLVCVLGTMALLGIPYSLLTSIITALSIGIGVDYTIHVIHRYREEFARLRNPETAAIRTLATTGSALLGSALTTALGIGVLVFSTQAGSRQFAITAAIAIAYSLVVAILLVPPAMTVWGAYQNMRLRSTVQRMWDEIDVAAEDIDRRRTTEGSQEQGSP